MYATDKFTHQRDRKGVEETGFYSGDEIHTGCQYYIILH